MRKNKKIYIIISLLVITIVGIIYVEIENIYLDIFNASPDESAKGIPAEAQEQAKEDALKQGLPTQQLGGGKVE